MNLSVHTIRVTIPSDVDGDFRVKTQDLNALLVSFGGKWDCSGPRPYNPDCDIDYNGYILKDKRQCKHNPTCTRCGKPIIRDQRVGHTRHRHYHLECFNELLF